ncbi:hypothetical protein SDC9_130288 [bioreactor metagenome]|uniref:Uncharacterized protein n=1 Tax=bioreactor metagenome TaxID=1076179 RepID=A0A645D224_9ZZZZ
MQGRYGDGLGLRVLPGKGVFGMHEQDDGVARIFAREQLGPVIKARKHGDVGVVALQIGQHLFGVAHADR